MIFGDLVVLNLPDICVTGEENPEKTSPRKLVPIGDRTRTRCVTGAHVIASSTTVDVNIENFVYRRSYRWWILREKFVSKLGFEPQTSSFKHWRPNQFDRDTRTHTNSETKYEWERGLILSWSNRLGSQCVKLEIWGSNPSLDTNFSLNIHHLYERRYTKFSILPSTVVEQEVACAPVTQRARVPPWGFFGGFPYL